MNAAKTINIHNIHQFFNPPVGAASRRDGYGKHCEYSILMRYFQRTHQFSRRGAAHTNVEARLFLFVFNASVFTFSILSLRF